MNYPAEKALKEMQQKLNLAGFQLKTVFQYMNYVYGIGYNDGINHYGKLRSLHKERPVIAIDMQGVRYGPFDSIVKAAKEMKVDFRNLSRACAHNWKYKGYYWRYYIKEPEENLVKPPA